MIDRPDKPRAFPLAVKCAAIDRLIYDFGWAKSRPDRPECETYWVLRAIAADLRGRMDGAPGACSHVLQRWVTAARRDAGYEGAKRQLADEVISRWATVRQALETFEAVVEAEARREA